ncbi:MAG: RNA-binding protein [Alphaproteobacteria bacterium]|nr:RNA-binding protein [Alphaproteobacteria bacterium]
MSRKAARERRDHQRGGDHDTAGGEPLRRCLVTGASLPKDQLVRFVAAPDDAVVPDVGNELPGRGAWVTANAKTIAKAVSKGQLAKALEAKADAALPSLVETLLVKRTLGLLGIARRAGLVVNGFERVKEALDLHEIGRARVAVLIEASDGSADGRRSILAKARAIGIEAPVCGLFTAAELSMALGGANVIHACLLSAGTGGLHARFLEEIGRTAGFRAMAPASWPAE